MAATRTIEWTLEEGTLYALRQSDGLLEALGGSLSGLSAAQIAAMLTAAISDRGTQASVLTANPGADDDPRILYIRRPYDQTLAARLPVIEVFADGGILHTNDPQEDHWEVNVMVTAVTKIADDYTGSDSHQLLGYIRDAFVASDFKFLLENPGNIVVEIVRQDDPPVFMEDPQDKMRHKIFTFTAICSMSPTYLTGTTTTTTTTTAA